MRLGGIGEVMTYDQANAYLRSLGFFTSADTTPDFSYWVWAYQLAQSFIAQNHEMGEANYAMYYGAPPEVVKAATTPWCTNLPCAPGVVGLSYSDLAALQASFCARYPCGSAEATTANALNTLITAAPTQTTISPMPPTNVLLPPAPQQTPTQQQIANGQTVTGGTLTNGASLPDLSGVTTWAQSNIGLIAAGVAAVFLLPMLMGGRQ